MLGTPLPNPRLLTAPVPCCLCSWPKLGLPAYSMQWEILEAGKEGTPSRPTGSLVRALGIALPRPTLGKESSRLKLEDKMAPVFSLPHYS